MHASLTSTRGMTRTGMHKRKSNTTRYDSRTRKLSWRVEWCFETAGVREVDESVPEEATLQEVLGKHLSYRTGAAAKQFPLRQYAETGMEQLKVFMRKERTPVGAGVHMWGSGGRGRALRGVVDMAM